MSIERSRGQSSLKWFAEKCVGSKSDTLVLCKCCIVHPGLFQFCDFLETHYLEEQVDSIKEFADLLCQAKKCGPGLGEFQFDKLAFKSDE